MSVASFRKIKPRFVVALPGRQHGAANTAFALAADRSAACWQRQHGRQALTALGEQFTKLPVPQHRCRQAQAPRGIGRPEQPVEGGAAVVAIPVEPIDPHGLVAALELVGGLFGEHEEVRRVRLADGAVLAARHQSFERVLPDRLHHRQTGLAVGMLAQLQQALVDQRFDAVDDVDTQILFRVGHGLGGLERAAADEDRQAAEQPLFGLAEQVVAPGNRRAQRLLTRRQIPRAAGQDLETALQPPQHRRRRQRLDAGRRQLDGQGQTVQPVADLGNRAPVLAGQREVGLGRRRPFHKQHDRRIARQGVERGRAQRDPAAAAAAPAPRARRTGATAPGW